MREPCLSSPFLPALALFPLSSFGHDHGISKGRVISFIPAPSFYEVRYR